MRGGLLLLGPAFVAAVAYIDPGNVATNFSAGARFGYALIWVVVVANLMAMVVQYQSAKVGVATGRDLPELCREHFPRPVLARPVGAGRAGGDGHRPGRVRWGGRRVEPAVRGAVVRGRADHRRGRFRDLGLAAAGYRRFELAIAGCWASCCWASRTTCSRSGPRRAGVASGLVPQFGGASSVLLAAAIVGATVMPHVVYLHSALTKRRVICRDDGERRELLRYQRLDVLVALGAAGLINLTMIVVAASSSVAGRSATRWIAAHAELGRLAGGGAALAFAVALLASGLSSSSVGTYAGQVVMQGFIRRRIPFYLRRAITMLPALIVLAAGVSPTQSLIVSQVLLSFGIPFALVPLLLVARRRDIMGALVNRGDHRDAAVIARRDHCAQRRPARGDLHRRLTGGPASVTVPDRRQLRRRSGAFFRNRPGRSWLRNCWRRGRLTRSWRRRAAGAAQARPRSGPIGPARRPRRRQRRRADDRAGHQRRGLVDGGAQGGRDGPVTAVPDGSGGREQLPGDGPAARGPARGQALRSQAARQGDERGRLEAHGQREGNAQRPGAVSAARAAARPRPPRRARAAPAPARRGSAALPVRRLARCASAAALRPNDGGVELAVGQGHAGRRRQQHDPGDRACPRAAAGLGDVARVPRQGADLPAHHRRGRQRGGELLGRTAAAAQLDRVGRVPDRLRVAPFGQHAAHPHRRRDLQVGAERARPRRWHCGRSSTASLTRSWSSSSPAR